MRWRYFVAINILCILLIGYYSYQFGKIIQRQADIKEYFSTIQEEEKFLIETIDLVICESGNKHEGVWGDNGKAYGRFQFWKIGFYDLLEKTDNQDLKLDWQDPTHQYFVYKEAYKKQIVSKYWTCYRKIEF